MTNDAETAASGSTPDPNTERLKVQLEIDKLQVEREKLQVEQSKARWTAFSIIVTGLAAVLTFAFGIWSQNQQSQSQFEIKAAELVLKAGSANEAQDTAKALAALFPHRLPSNFAGSFDPKAVPGFGADIVSAKTELLRILPGKSAQQKKEIIELWNRLFPEDKTF